MTMKAVLPESSQSSFETPPLPSAKRKIVSVLSQDLKLNPSHFSTRFAMYVLLTQK